MKGQKEYFLILLVLVTCLSSTLQHPHRRRATPLDKKASETYEEVDVMATTSHEMNCSAETLLGFKDDNCNITWTFNGDPMPRPYGSSTFKQFSYFGPETLRSSSTNSKDAGNYTCTVISSNGTVVTKTINLCITTNEETEEPPTMLSITEDSRAMLGDVVTFTCQAYVGTPRCLHPYQYPVSWSKMLKSGNMKPLESSDDVIITKSMNESGMMRSTLKIKRVRSEHFGIYKCVIQNKIGYREQNVTLTKGIPDLLFLAGQYRAAVAVLFFILFFMMAAVYFWRRFRIALALFYKNPPIRVVSSKCMPEKGKVPSVPKKEEKVMIQI